jgi:hypothetical protein
MRRRSSTGRVLEFWVGAAIFTAGAVGAALLAVGVARPDPFVRPVVPPGPLLIYTSTEARP